MFAVLAFISALLGLIGIALPTDKWILFAIMFLALSLLLDVRLWGMVTSRQ